MSYKKVEGSLSSKVEEAINVFKPGEEFTSTDVVTLTQIMKGRVQMYFSAFCKQGKIVLINKDKYPYVYRRATEQEKANHEKARISNKKQKQLIKIEPVSTRQHHEAPECPSDIGSEMISPLQIGIGIVELIENLKKADGHELTQLRSKVKELDGQIQFKEQTIKNKNATIQELRDAIIFKDRQIDQLGRHVAGVKKGDGGIKLSDVLFGGKKK
jgi:hypothetical protein